jgi:Regulator of chromosome condensation (RCC1) repeat
MSRISSGSALLCVAFLGACSGDDHSGGSPGGTGGTSTDGGGGIGVGGSGTGGSVGGSADAGGLPAGGTGGGSGQVAVAWAAEHIASGLSQSCAIDRAGHVVCWGPQRVEDKRNQLTYSRVVGTALETCVLDQGSSIECWGSATNSAPTGSFARIASGGFFDCALDAAGTVSCWSDSQPSHVAITSIPPDKFTAIKAGKNHVCGLLQGTANIKCWGVDLAQRLVAPPGPFAQLSVGEFHSCALRTDGTMGCWGGNGIDAAVPRNGQFFQVSAGDGHSCAIRADDKSVVCWGGAEVSVQLVPPSGAFVEIAAGHAHACGIREDGTLACWGENLGTMPAGFVAF